MVDDDKISGWWLNLNPLEKKSDLVNWDDDIPNIWENTKMFQTTNQLGCNQ